MSFAAPMKEALYRLNPDIRDISGLVYSVRQAVDLAGWEGAKDLTPDVRGYLQRFGTEVGREMFGENFWVDQAIKRIPDGSKVVFSDVRYPNEAEAIKNLGGKVWRVLRDGVGPANDHASEHALVDYYFDLHIDNSGSLESLYDSIDTTLGYL